jgi:CRISPR/Cas system CSM-associated protein Csm3 (group 7 of RAMP superfamily)
MTPQRLDLIYCIHWESSWHVGSGYASAAADRLIRRFGGIHGTPFVPGSLLKGVLRHQCERLVLALGFEAVDPHATSKSQEDQLVQHFQPLTKSPLMVDRLFGSRFQGECLFMDNALPPAGLQSLSDHQASTLRTRTALDRVTGTVREGHLFTTELVEGGGAPVLEGRLRARHPGGVLTPNGERFPFEYALLVTALLSMETLGGNKSAGLGQCRLTIKEGTLRWNGAERGIDYALASFEENYDVSRNRDEWTDMVKLVRGEDLT